MPYRFRRLEFRRVPERKTRGLLQVREKIAAGITPGYMFIDILAPVRGTPAVKIITQ
jgi:hypothetical protein